MLQELTYFSHIIFDQMSSSGCFLI